jgi:hypothetical protein
MIDYFAAQLAASRVSEAVDAAQEIMRHRRSRGRAPRRRDL